MVTSNEKVLAFFLAVLLSLSATALASCAQPSPNAASSSGSPDAQEASVGERGEGTPVGSGSNSEATVGARAHGEALSVSDLPSDTEASEADLTDSPASSGNNGMGDTQPMQTAPLAYPTGWLAAPIDDIPAGVPVGIVYLPGFSIAAHREGMEVAADDPSLASDDYSETAVEGEAAILYGGAVRRVPADYLLVNLPDVLSQAVYDVVYSYASTSRCAGEVIPGVTGEQLPGYVAGAQQSDYWGEPQFAVPCAYRTALKAQWVCDDLSARGYRLLVFDAYRPMTAQYYLSDCFVAAYQTNAAMQAGLGWSLTWYVANGPSGHNFGTDLDVGVCDAAGTPLPMPSQFDALDESGHLTSYQLNAGDITPAAYRPEVAGNAACLALHEAFRSAGFSELASEWWHFGDGEAEGIMRSIVGPGGLDFVASL